MLVSVIIPVYNGSRYLERLFFTFSKQTFKDFEIVFIDDCSTDNSYELLFSLKNKYSLTVQILQNDTNRGPGYSRNVAVQKAKGELLSFCDSDDFYEDNYLEKMTGEIINKKKDIVFCDYSYVYSDGTKKIVSFGDLNQKCKTKNDWIAFSQMSLCRIMTKREFFLLHPAPEIYHCEDAAVIPLVVSECETFAHICEPLYCYCLHKNSSSVGRPNKKVVDEILQASRCISNSCSKEYHDSFEYVNIILVLYGGVLNAYKAGCESRDIKKIVSDFSSQYPQWRKNSYIRDLSVSKKIFLSFVEHKLWLLLKLYSKIHYLIVQKKAD